MAFMLRGEAFRAVGESDKAIDDMTKAIKLGVPDWAHAYGQRGAERLKKGDLKGAVADSDKAIASDPKLAIAYLGRGTAHVGLGNVQKAIADLTLAVKLDSSLKTLAQPLLRMARRSPAKNK